MATKAKDGVLFFGGVPTDTDIATLRNAYPVEALTEGRVIPYEEVGKLIMEGPKTHRFRTVTNRWRKMLEKENSIVLGAKAGVGFLVLSPQERVTLASGHLHSSSLQAVRAHRRSGDVPRARLTTEEGKRADHILHVSAAVISHGRLLSRQEKPELQEIKK
jgi:hypothetical protein